MLCLKQPESLRVTRVTRSSRPRQLALCTSINNYNCVGASEGKKSGTVSEAPSFLILCSLFFLLQRMEESPCSSYGWLIIKVSQSHSKNELPTSLLRDFV